MDYRKIIVGISAVFSAVGVSGCLEATAACVSAGICDAPPDPTVTIDVICDTSSGSTCTPETIDMTLAQTMPLIAQRAGSTLRLWSMSGTVDGVVTLGIVTSPPTVPSLRARTLKEAAFVKAEKARLLRNASTAFVQPAGQSPIAETMARVLMATSSGERRAIVIISDMRQFENQRVDFECGNLPSPQDFAKHLIDGHVLTPDAMTGIGVAFSFVGVPPVDGGRCAATIQRAREIEVIWKTAVTTTGGTVLAYTDGPVAGADVILY